jgi:hypothetical protein
MSRRHSTRRQSRRAVLWRVFYGSEELAGEGSILDIHETGCRVAGCMPVETGMHLRLCIWPSQNPQDIVVAQGLVTWTKGLQFGVVLSEPFANAAHGASGTEETATDISVPASPI